MELSMSLSLHINEPSSLNSIYCGAGINFCRDQIQRTESNPSASNNERMMTRFVCSIGMELFGLASTFEAVARLVDTLRLYICYKLAPQSYEKSLQEGIKNFLLSARVCLTASNPISICALLALSALPNAYKTQGAPQDFSAAGKRLELGPFAKLPDSNSFLDATIAGRQINKARVEQTTREMTPIENKELILSRLKVFATCLAAAVFSAGECLTYLSALISYGLYLSTLSSEKFRELLKISDAEFTNKMLKLETLAQKFLTSLFIISNFWNPLTSMFCQPLLLLTVGAEMAHPDAFKVPEETQAALRARA